MASAHKPQDSQAVVGMAQLLAEAYRRVRQVHRCAEMMVWVHHQADYALLQAAARAAGMDFSFERGDPMSPNRIEFLRCKDALHPRQRHPRHTYLVVYGPALVVHPATRRGHRPLGDGLRGPV